MLGKPKFKLGQEVSFKIDEIVLTGKVEIIDAYGTFEQSDDVSYDVMVENSPHFNGSPCLYKHLVETELFTEIDGPAI